MALTHNQSGLMSLQSSLNSQCKPRETASFCQHVRVLANILASSCWLHWGWMFMHRALFPPPPQGYCLKNSFVFKLDCQYKSPTVLPVLQLQDNFFFPYIWSHGVVVFQGIIISPSGFLSQMCYKDVKLCVSVLSQLIPEYSVPDAFMEVFSP